MNRKSNLRHGLSLMLSILFADILSIFVFISLASVLPNVFGTVLIQILNLLILLSLVYLPVWTVGEKDINYVLTGKITYDRYSGLKIGLIGMTVLYLPYILLFLSKINNDQFLYAIFQVVSSPFYGFIRMLLPITIKDVNWLPMFVTLIYPLIISLITSVAYHFGYKRVSLTGKLIYKKKK